MPSSGPADFRTIAGNAGGAGPVGRTFTARLAAAPFPYDGEDADGGVGFFTAADPATGRRLHVTGDGTTYAEHPHYDRDTVLFHLPPAFDPQRPLRIVVFLHQHLVTVPEGIIAAGVPEQIDRSGRNLVLVAPQLARNAIDSSPGKLYRPDGTSRLLGEAAAVLARATGAPAAVFDKAPVVLTAFSGGYKAAAYSLDRGGLGQRVGAVLLLDGIFGCADMFASWILSRRDDGVFVTLFTDRCAKETGRTMDRLDDGGAAYRRTLPQTLPPGSACFVAVDTDHFDVLSDGPPQGPIAEVLRRLAP